LDQSPTGASLVCLVASTRLDTLQNPRWTWKQLRRSSTGRPASAAEGLTLYNPAKTRVERYRFR
jgi:hypothetical protein